MRKPRTIAGVLDGVPGSLLNCIVDRNRELFHTKNKQIRGEGIPLPETMRWLEKRHPVPIPKDRKSG